ncbi:hypothetical protein [Spirilliplanes yamanashiensis]|uniref:Uncharacterized protein n=1 Tax=Spirilliplanes yamanashiensis TaxID=42233 RepID=A0A8J3YE95_9ACTN|nr:hypothetical protein [Spirilliplanes yamanashiensis]MDP9816604.1 ElaB/YqjD/DUF883 family membrane-anchored ribosome-binding protein [Spirilliplanes yamanashiensis]GIJ06130.1 hypothetical protein Sya03_54820 [Spirilliplanes yamanashiensis]
MLSSRKNASERAAAQAWEYLTSAVSAAGDSAKNAGLAVGDSARTAGKAAGRAAGRQGSRLAAETGSRVGSTADEAWRRANRAVDALAGRRPATPWALLALAAVAGAAIGFAAAATLRTAVDRRTTEPAGALDAPPPPTTEQVHLDAE